VGSLVADDVDSYDDGDDESIVGEATAVISDDDIVWMVEEGVDVAA
jgi:hypothetical protein